MFNILVNKEEKEKRYNICNLCVSFNKEKGICKECNCIMKYKTKFKTSNCPLKKW